ncbi:hypothetical protein SLA2020_146200 [Shorea laevis]
MSVREKLSIFENLQSPSLPSSSQESDLCDRSSMKIPNSDPITDTSMVDSPSPPAMQGVIPMSEDTQPSNLASLSYRDKLLFDENPVVVSFATTLGYMDEDSDVDEDPDDPTPIILLSKAEKRRIREPWMNALIIKAFHSKPLGYNYVYPRVKAQWKPTGKWDFIDLGLDFFLVRFQVPEDLNRVIFGGPWFVGPYYLTIRRWEPNFDPAKAINSTTTTAVWARFPNLSADHYDPTTLQKIGNEVGTLLRVDAHTAHHTRGQYARVCVQIDLSRPVVKTVRIGKKKQRVLYEGVNALCFNCGRIGHRNNQCPGLKDKIPPIINAIPNASTVSSDPKLAGASNAQEPMIIIEDANTKNLATQGDSQQDCTEFGPWLLVERRKPRKKAPVIGNSSEKTMATTVPSSSRGSGAPTRKLGPKSQSGSTTNRVSQTNGPKPGAFNAEQTNVKSGVSAMTGKAVQLENSNGQKFKEPQWVIKNSSKVQNVSKGQGYLEPRAKTKPISDPNPKAQNTLELVNAPVSFSSSEPTPITGPISTTHVTGVDFSSQPNTSCAPPLFSLTPSPNSSSISTSLCTPSIHGTLQLPIPSPKPPNLLSEGQHQDSSGLCFETDVSQCLSKERELDNATDPGGMARSDNHLQSYGSAGDSTSHPSSISRPSLKRTVSDHESRVYRRNHYRRGLGPYHSASNFQLSLHASSEDNQHEGQAGTSSFSVQNTPLVVYEDRNGLRDSPDPLPLPPSEVSAQGPEASSANLGLVTSPDPAGNLKSE